jgi:hypothetical protein
MTSLDPGMRAQERSAGPTVYPFWSLAIFAVDVAIVYGLAVYRGQGRTA